MKILDEMQNHNDVELREALTVLMNLELPQRLVNAVVELRHVVSEYNALDETAQKQARHLLYQRQGSFGKALVRLFPEFAEIEMRMPS